MEDGSGRQAGNGYTSYPRAFMCHLMCVSYVVTVSAFQLFLAARPPRKQRASYF